MDIGVITNPNSRKNKGRPNRAAELQSIVGDRGEVHATDTIDSIKPILREFLRRRARYWVADGGDGALHCMLRAGLEILEEPEFQNGTYELPTTVPTNGGTIDFVANHVGIKGRAEEILNALRGHLESGTAVEEVEVDSMLVEGLQIDEAGEAVPFRTFGFASAVGGVGQRFYSKYYADADPNARTILKVVGNTLASMPVALSPLRAFPGLPSQLRHYARDIFKPTDANIAIDGMVLPERAFTGVHIAAMSINLGGVFRFFGQADEPGRLHAIVGSPSPMGIVANLPRMTMGRKLRGPHMIDRPCRKMTVEALGSELLAPIIDGEYYRDVKSVSFDLGPRVRIPKIVGRRLSH